MAKKKILEEVKFFMEKGQGGGSLFGIANYMEDYKIAYHLNKLLSIELEREADLQFWRKKQETPEYYSFYSYTDSFNHLMYLLMSTKSCSGETILHKNFKGLDKLFFIFGRDHLVIADLLNKRYREIPNTLLIKNFDFSLDSDDEKNESLKNQPHNATGLLNFFEPENENNELIQQSVNTFSNSLKPEKSEPKKDTVKQQKEQKILTGLLDFLEDELLPEIEMNLMESRDHKKSVEF